MKARAFIADDEPPARSKIRRFLQECDDIELAGEAGDGLIAIEKILELRPDLLFLDIQMPQGDGFEVLREVYVQHKPVVIFTTAYDQYALKAFEVEAIDYLLKPFTAERFHAAVERALRELRGARQTNKVEHLLEQISANQARSQRILVRKDDRMFFVKAKDIEWVEAEEKYVLLHTRTQQHHMIRQSITTFEDQLGPSGFVRIHRSHLLNLEALQEVINLGRGDCVAVLQSGTRLNVGRNFKERLLASMGQHPSRSVQV